MSELRVPTVAIAAEVVCADRRSFKGRVFLPAAASHHTGATRPEEWMNDGVQFFPFLPDDTQAPVFLNKREILLLTLPASCWISGGEATGAEGPGSAVDAALPHRRVSVECADRRLEGTIAIDMPDNRQRVIDYLNRPDAFLTLLDGERCHLVQKERITRVVEILGS